MDIVDFWTENGRNKRLPSFFMPTTWLLKKPSPAEMFFYKRKDLPELPLAHLSQSSDNRRVDTEQTIYKNNWLRAFTKRDLASILWTCH